MAVINVSYAAQDHFYSDLVLHVITWGTASVGRGGAERSRETLPRSPLRNKDLWGPTGPYGPYRRMTHDPGTHAPGPGPGPVAFAM